MNEAGNMVATCVGKGFSIKAICRRVVRLLNAKRSAQIFSFRVLTATLFFASLAVIDERLHLGITAQQANADLVTFYDNTQGVTVNNDSIPHGLDSGIFSSSSFGSLNSSSNYFNEHRIIERLETVEYWPEDWGQFYARIGLVKLTDTNGQIDPLLYDTNTHYNSTLNSYLSHESLVTSFTVQEREDGLSRLIFDNLNIPLAPGEIAFPIIALYRHTGQGDPVTRMLNGNHIDDYLHDRLVSLNTKQISEYNYHWNSGNDTAIAWGAWGTSSAIPEPSSVMLLGLATVGLLLSSRKRNSNPFNEIKQ